MQVFYVNIGGGEPTVRPRLLGAARLRRRPPGRREVLHQRQPHHAEDRRAAGRPATTSTCRSRSTAPPPRSTTRVRGAGLLRHGDPRAWSNLAEAGFGGFKISVVVHPRERRPARRVQGASPTAIGAQLRLTRLRPSGRGADVWDELHPTAGQQRELYDWLLAHGEAVLTGDSFFHLSGYGESLPGLNLCGAGRVVCLIDPVGDVYACPFAIHDEFLAGNVRVAGGFAAVWRESELFARAAQPADRRRLRVVLGPTTPAGAAAWRPSSSPACRSTAPTPSACSGHGEAALAARSRSRPAPKPSRDHSKPGRGATGRTLATIGPAPRIQLVRIAACDESPPAGMTAARADGKRLVRDGGRGAAARQEAPAQVGVRRAGRRLGAGHDARGQRRRLRRARLRPPRGRPGRTSATWPPRSWARTSRCR